MMDAKLQDEWTTKRRELLAKEKELTALGDEVSRLRRAMPRLAIDKPYAFQDKNGQLSLLDLFEGKSQLIVFHFMYGENWDAGCPSCSFWADNFDGIDVHLRHRDIAFVAASSAPYEKLAAYKERMGWRFRWVSAHGSEFNQDMKVSFVKAQNPEGVYYNYRQLDWFAEELPGLSVFYRDDKDQVFHTYSTYSRGLDRLNGAYQCMDLVPLGRNESGRPAMSWVRRHDEYEDN